MSWTTNNSNTQKILFAGNEPGILEPGLRDQSNGYVGINSNGEVLGTFTQRKDISANISSIILANGELAFTTDTNEIFIGDGSTLGGKFLYSAVKRHYREIIVSSTTTIANEPNPILIPVSPGKYKIIAGMYGFIEFGSSDLRWNILTVSGPPISSGWMVKTVGEYLGSTSTSIDPFFSSNSSGYTMPTGLIEPCLHFDLSITIEVATTIKYVCGYNSPHNYDILSYWIELQKVSD